MCIFASKGGFMSEKKLLFIYNPRSGKGQIKAHLLDIIDTFVKAGYEVTARPTQYAGEAVMLAEQIREEYEMVVCSGGDGTLDQVVTGIMRSGRKIPIGYIPSGSTNDFANSLYLPKDMKKAAQVAMEGKLLSCDVGEFNKNNFVYIAAFGMFTEVSYETDQEMKNLLGHMAYVLEGAKKLTAIKSYRMKIVTEDQVIEDEFLLGMVTNSISVGGFKGMTGRVVDLSDGQFEVTLIKRPRHLEDLNQIINAVTMRDIDAARMYCYQASRLEFFCEEEVAWTLDGEFGGKHTQVLLENRQQAMQIVVPCETIRL